MADDGLDGLDEGTDSSAPAKKNKVGGLFDSLLKWIAIALGAIILIVVIVYVTVKIVGNNKPTGPVIALSYPINTWDLLSPLQKGHEI